MPKRLTFFLALVLFLPKSGLAYADVVINEFVPYGTTEWVELLNTMDSEISLDGWSLVDAANHVKLLTPLGSIPAHGIVVYEYSAASSGWLNNDADSIELRDAASGSKDNVSYGTAELAVPGTGKSAALISGAWQTNQEPTKGAANSSSGGASGDNNEDSGNNNDDNDDSSSSFGVSNSSASTAAPAVSSKIKAEVSARSIAYVGIPFAFQGKVTQGGQQVYRGKYFWNFGDGDFREVKVISTDKFTHTYFYPGEYTVVFEHYANYFSEEPDASQELAVKVIKPEVSISRVGDGSDFFVELFNNTAYEVDMSGWLLIGSGKSFVIPKNTVIGGKKKIIISGRTSGLTLSDLPALKLASPDGGIVFEYSNSLKSPLSGGSPKPSVSPDKGRERGVNENAENSGPDNLAASVAYAGGPGEDGAERSLSRFVWPLAFMGFLAAGAYMAYFIRQKKVAPQAGDDFELLDE